MREVRDHREHSGKRFYLVDWQPSWMEEAAMTTTARAGYWAQRGMREPPVPRPRRAASRGRRRDRSAPAAATAAAAAAAAAEEEAEEEVEAQEGLEAEEAEEAEQEGQTQDGRRHSRRRQGLPPA